MSEETTPTLQPCKRWAKGQSRPRYLQPDDLDKMMIMFVALMSEVSALRDRLDTHEAVPTWAMQQPRRRSRPMS